MRVIPLNVSSIRGWIVRLMRHLQDCCVSTGALMQIGLMICWHLFQMQYLRAARKYLGCGILQNSMCQGGMSEQWSWMLDPGRQWATGILLGVPEVVHLLSWNVGHELPSGMKWNFWERMRINFVPYQCFQNLGRMQWFLEQNKSTQPKKESLPLTVGGTSGESNNANLWKNKKALGNDGITLEVYRFASEQLLTMMSIFLSGCMLTGKLPSALMHVVIIPYWSENLKIQQMWTITGQLQLPQLSPRYWVLRLARYLWTADSQFGFKQAHGTEMVIFSLKQTVDFYRNQDTPVYMCFLDAKRAFDRVNHFTLAKKLMDRNAPLHIVKLFIFWYC